MSKSYSKAKDYMVKYGKHIKNAYVQDHFADIATYTKRYLFWADQYYQFLHNKNPWVMNSLRPTYIHYMTNQKTIIQYFGFDDKSTCDMVLSNHKLSQKLGTLKDPFGVIDQYKFTIFSISDCIVANDNEKVPQNKKYGFAVVWTLAA